MSVSAFRQGNTFLVIPSVAGMHKTKSDKVRDTRSNGRCKIYKPVMLYMWTHKKENRKKINSYAKTV